MKHNENYLLVYDSDDLDKEFKFTIRLFMYEQKERRVLVYIIKKLHPNASVNFRNKLSKFMGRLRYKKESIDWYKASGVSIIKAKLKDNKK